MSAAVKPYQPVTGDLQLINFSKAKTDLSQIDNCRFMYHPSGFLILGSSDVVRSKVLLYSHAEEYSHIADVSSVRLPPFDDFTRGWIGVGGKYKNGIIHFAPHITGEANAQFNAAVDFIQISMENGLTENCVLRGFGKPWEQKISQALGKQKIPFAETIKNAQQRKVSRQPSAEYPIPGHSRTM